MQPKSYQILCLSWHDTDAHLDLPLNLTSCTSWERISESSYPQPHSSHKPVIILAHTFPLSSSSSVWYHCFFSFLWQPPNKPPGGQRHSCNTFLFVCLRRKRRVCRNLQGIRVLLLRLVLEPDSKQQWWNHVVIQNPAEERTDAAHGQIGRLRQPGSEKRGCLTRH